MQIVMSILDFFIHLDRYLKEIVVNYGVWAYAILFLVIFIETGLVVFPFLPGDSVHFMVGTLAASGIFALFPSTILLMTAAITGNVVNYHVGKYIGPKAFSKEEAKFFNKDNLVKAQRFYEKYGGAAIVIGRFMPIIRTFVPFAAGIGTMRYGKFMFFNALGSILWVGIFLFSGFFFGNIPFVSNNLTIIIYAIVVVSFIPPILGLVRSRIERRKEGLQRGTAAKGGDKA